MLGGSTQLSASDLAAEMKTQLQQRKGPLPASQDLDDLFGAIAAAVVGHLLSRSAAFTVTIDDLPADGVPVEIAGDAS